MRGGRLAGIPDFRESRNALANTGDGPAAGAMLSGAAPLALDVVIEIRL
jgi:hypothetical protein